MHPILSNLQKKSENVSNQFHMLPEILLFPNFCHFEFCFPITRVVIKVKMWYMYVVGGEESKITITNNSKCTNF